MKKINIILLLYVMIFTTLQASNKNPSPLSKTYADEFQNLLAPTSNQRTFSPQQSKTCATKSTSTEDLTIEPTETQEHLDLEQSLDIALKEREYYRVIASRLAITSFFLVNVLLAKR